MYCVSPGTIFDCEKLCQTDVYNHGGAPIKPVKEVRKNRATDFIKQEDKGIETMNPHQEIG